MGLNRFVLPVCLDFTLDRLIVGKMPRRLYFFERAKPETPVPVLGTGVCCIN